MFTAYFTEIKPLYCKFCAKVPVERCPQVGHDSYPPSRLRKIFSRCGRDTGNQTVLLTGTFV